MNTKITVGTSRKAHRITFIYVLLIVFCIFSIFPILWMVVTSIKQATEMYTIPPKWFPSKPVLDNYKSVVQDPRMRRYFFNSCVISGSTTLVTVIFGTMAAYAFSRFRFRVNGPLYIFIMVVKMLPAIVLILPLYILFSKINLIDSYFGLVISYMALTLPLSIWLLRGFIQNIPVELEESAMLEGCSRFGVLFRVVFPLITPGFLSVGMYVFLLSWNAYLFPLILTSSKEVQPLTIGLTYYLSEYQVLWGNLMAASVLMTVPPLIIFLLFQKWLSHGLVEGAVKG